MSLALTTSRAEAKVVQRSLARTQQSGSSVAVDPQGRTHIAYHSAGNRLRHTWQDRGRWRDELVDRTSEAGWYASLAVDAQGGLHLGYCAMRPEVGQLSVAYAYFDGSSWQVTDLGDKGHYTVVAVDAQGHPHLAFSPANDNAVIYARFDGMNWIRERISVPAVPTGLKIDAEGHAHLSAGTNGVQYYATNSGGSWNSTALPESGFQGAVALDSTGVPHVASAAGSTFRYYSFNGTSWEGEEILEAPEGVTLTADYVSLVMDEQDHPQLLLSAYASEGRRSGEVAAYAHHDGVGWSYTLLNQRNGGFEVSIDRAPGGKIVGTYRQALRGEKSILRYVEVSQLDLSATWVSAKIKGEMGASTQVDALLSVKNEGGDAAKPVSVSFFLSSDGVLDPADEALGITRRVGALPRGRERRLRITFSYAGSLQGQYLIAVVDPGRARDDRDRTNNTAEVLLDTGMSGSPVRQKSSSPRFAGR